jgi:hypothetical protein
MDSGFGEASWAMAPVILPYEGLVGRVELIFYSRNAERIGLRVR